MSLHNPIPNLLLFFRRHRSALLITTLLPNMLVGPRMSFTKIRIPQKVQILTPHLRWHGVTSASDCFWDGRSIGGTLPTV